MQALSTPPPPVSTRQANKQNRDARIRAEFKVRFTDQPRPRKYTREYVISQIALDWCLSMGTVENILYTKPLEQAAAPAASLAQAA